MPSFPIIIIAFLPIFLTLTHGINSELLLEDGYSVTTLIDGDKFSLNPNAVLTGSSLNDDVIVLDSVRSSVFTVSFKGGEVSEIKKLSGNADGKAGYKDGDLGSAEFNKPKSFAIDKKNNIYIADKSNYVIRKISKSDHGNRLVRQLNLKAEDCAGSSSGSVLGSSAAWGIGLGVACLFGLMVGFIVRPYVLPYTGRFRPSATQHDMEALPNESGETSDLLLRHEKRTC